MLYIIAGLLVLVIAFLVLKASAGSEVYSRFGVSESTHQLLGTDLGKSTKGVRLSRFGINGIADAVFTHKQAKEIVVGEFKSRKQKGRVRYNELYQLLLYMGHLAEKYPDHTIKGCLAYADSRETVHYDHEVYSALVSLRGELIAAFRNRRPPNTTPLHRRMNVSAQNAHLRLVAPPATD